MICQGRYSMTLYDDNSDEMKYFWKLVRIADKLSQVDRKTVENVYDFYQDNGYLTQDQIDEVLRIARKFRSADGQD